MNIDGQNIFLRAIRNEHVSSSDDSYPFNLPIVRNLKTLEFSKSVTYIVGENGSGKSTLLVDEGVFASSGESFRIKDRLFSYARQIKSSPKVQFVSGMKNIRLFDTQCRCVI